MLHQLCRAAVLLAAFLLCTGSAAAQSSDRPHAIEDGSWAVLYQVQDILQINLLDGMLAVKYHLADQHALRFGLGGNVSTWNGEDRINGVISSQAQLLVYPHPQREVKFYVGAGPHVGFYINRSELPDSSTFRDERWKLGVAGALGTEWFATKHISILAEYGNLLGVEITEQENTSNPGISTDYFYSMSARMGIAAYF